MLTTKISDLIKQLEEYKKEHGDIPVLAAIYAENIDCNGPYEGDYLLSPPTLSHDTYVEHTREDGTFSYGFLKSTNPTWKHGQNIEHKVLLVGN